MFLVIFAMTQASYAENVPRPKAPLIPRITSVDQLVPFAKIVLKRDFIGQRLGWNIKGGERVLGFPEVLAPPPQC